MPFHVLTAEFLHESNTFKQGATTLCDFVAHVLYDGEAGLFNAGNPAQALA